MTAKTKTATRKAPKTTQATKAAKATEAKEAAKTKLSTPAKRMSALDAAHAVLSREGKSLNAKELIAAMTGYGFWTSPGGKTPHATLYAAMLREIGVKGDASRFRRATKGHFAVAGVEEGKASKAPKAVPAAKAPKAAPTAKAKATKAEPAAIPDGTPGPKSVSDMFRL